MRQETVTADGITPYQIVDHKDGAWHVDTPQDGLSSTERRSWTKPGQYYPDAFTTITGSIDLPPYINKRANLPLTQEIPLDGSATLEVFCL